MKTNKDLVPFASPWLGEEEVEAASRVIRSGWVTQGPEVAAFEADFARFVGAKYACAVNSCTSALHLALLVLGVGPGDKVITVSHSFIASANVVRHCGAIPVFVDIEPDTYNLKTDLIEQVIGPRTRAIIAVHQMGMPCDLAAILEIGKRRGIPVIEDAACALGSEINLRGQWEQIGRPHAPLACFSFHPRKTITTGDGGMITTQDERLDGEVRARRQHGMTVADAARAAARKVIFEEYPVVGYNYRMTDLEAAIGRVQLRRLPEALEQRRTMGARYKNLLKEAKGIGLPAEPAWARTNWQSFCVRLPEGLVQREIMQAMLDRGVATRRGVMNAHREKSYSDGRWSCGEGPGPCGCPPNRCRRLRESERAQDQCILLPMFSQMTKEQQDKVINVLREVCQL